MTLIEEIKAKLQALEPTFLDLQDESALHVGHAGNGGGGHFKLIIASHHFNALSAVSAHRKIYTLLEDLMPSKIHALSIQAQGVN